MTNAELKKVLVVEKILDGLLTYRKVANLLGLISETIEPSYEIIASSSLQCEVDFARQGHGAKECGEDDPLVMQEGFRRCGVQLDLHSNRHTIFHSPNELRYGIDLVFDGSKEICMIYHTTSGYNPLI